MKVKAHVIDLDPIAYQAGDPIAKPGKMMWSQDEQVAKNLKIMTVASYDSALSDSLTNSNISFDEKEIIKSVKEGRPGDPSTINTDNMVQIQSRNVTYKEPMVANFTEHYYCHEFSFLVPKSASEVKLFSCVIMDSVNLLSQNKVDIYEKESIVFRGSTSSETIIEGSKVSNKSSVFVKKDGGDQWPGPIHYHNENGFMAGPRHTSRPHPALKRIDIGNYKIKDFRKSKYDRIQNRVDSHFTPFGSFYYSFNQLTNLNSVFMINIKDLIIHKTAYGSMMQSLDESLINEMISNFRIRNLQIYKKRIRPAFENTKIGGKKLTGSEILSKEKMVETYDITNGFLKEMQKFKQKSSQVEMFLNFAELETRRQQEEDPEAEISPEARVKARMLPKPKTPNMKELKPLANIRQINLLNNRMYRTVEFQDFSINANSVGEYKYSVVLSFKDPTVKFTIDLIKRLRTAIKDARSYISSLDKPSNYDKDLGKVLDRFTTFQLQSYPTSLRDAPFVRPVDIYVKYMSYLYNLTNSEKKQLFDKQLSKMHPKFCTIESANDFLNDLQSLAIEFDKHFEFNFDQFSNYTDFSNPRKNPSSHLITVTHEFEDVITPYKWDKFYNFLEPIDNNSDFPSLNGIRKMNYQQFSDRINLENDKLFQTKRGQGNLLETEEDYFGDSESKKTLNDVDSSSLNYLSPHSLQEEDSIINCFDVGQIDIDLFNDFFENIEPDASDIRFKQTKPRRRRRFKSYKHSKKRKSAGKKTKKHLIRQTRSSFSPFGIQISLPSIKIIDKQKDAEEEDADFRDSKDFLGPDSPFVFYGAAAEELREAAKMDEEEIKETQNMILKKKSARMKKRFSREKFDIASNDNFLSKVKSKYKKSIYRRKMQRMPNHLKALYGSKSKNVKVSLFDQEVDAFNNRETELLMKVNFLTLLQIEVFRGFEVQESATGAEPLLNKPIWKPITKQDISTPSPLFCRMQYYFDNDFNIKPDSDTTLPFADKYFIVADDILTESITIPSDEQVSTDEAEVAVYSSAASNDIYVSTQYNIDYSTTNIVAQSQNTVVNIETMEDEYGPEPTATTSPNRTAASTTRATSGTSNMGRGGY